MGNIKRCLTNQLHMKLFSLIEDLHARYCNILYCKQKWHNKRVKIGNNTDGYEVTRKTLGDYDDEAIEKTAFFSNEVWNEENPLQKQGNGITAHIPKNR